jgi:hypothetical protein
MPEHLLQELEEASAALRAHLASWEYAFAMGSSCHGATEHPQHWATRDRTERLRRRIGELRALLAEHDL